jgi:hypothetical protein
MERIAGRSSRKTASIALAIVKGHCGVLVLSIPAKDEGSLAVIIHNANKCGGDCNAVCYGSVAGLLHPFGGKAVDVGCNVSYPAIGEPYWNRVAGKGPLVGIGENNADLKVKLWEFYTSVGNAAHIFGAIAERFCVLSIICH